MTLLNHDYYRNHDHRRILLIDENRTKQELRATILRNYEIEVHTASTITEAATRWRTYSYDLVLVAAQEKSEEASAVTTQIRSIRPGQRIGLLVGPPTFVRELGGRRRRKATSAIKTSPGRAIDDSSAAISAPHTSPPQWQVMISKLVSNWYVDQDAFLRLPG